GFGGYRTNPSISSPSCELYVIRSSRPVSKLARSSLFAWLRLTSRLRLFSEAAYSSCGWVNQTAVNAARRPSGVNANDSIWRSPPRTLLTEPLAIPARYKAIVPRSPAMNSNASPSFVHSNVRPPAGGHPATDRSMDALTERGAPPSAG